MHKGDHPLQTSKRPCLHLQAEILTCRWSNEDPNPVAVVQKKRDYADAFEEVSLCSQCLLKTNVVVRLPFPHTPAYAALSPHNGQRCILRIGA